MSTLNFPTNPTLGQLYTIGSNTWQWNGSGWVRYNDPNKVFVTVTAGQIFVTTSTEAVSTTTGALVITGGVGIGGDLYIGGTFYAGGDAVLTTASFAYSINEGQDIRITLSSSTGALIFDNISTLQSVTSRGNTTTNNIKILNTTQSTGTTTGALVVSGGVGIGGNTYVEGRVNSESVKIEDTIFDSSSMNLSLNNTTVIDIYSLNQYRAAKYFVQIADGTGPGAEYCAQEITVIAGNTGTVDINVYGLVSTNGDDFGNFDVIVDGTDVKLRYTPDFATQKTIKLLRTAMTT